MLFQRGIDSDTSTRLEHGGGADRRAYVVLEEIDGDGTRHTDGRLTVQRHDLLARQDHLRGLGVDGHGPRQHLCQGGEATNLGNCKGVVLGLETGEYVDTKVRGGQRQTTGRIRQRLQCCQIGRHQCQSRHLVIG